MEVITNRQWDTTIRRIVNTNCKNHGRSSSDATISNQCHDLIIEIRDNTKTMFVKDDWRAEMKKRFLHPVKKINGVHVIKGDDAGTIARHKARYGHRDWFIWRDKDNTLCAAVATSASCKMAMLATGTQKTFTRIEGSNCRAYSSSCWSIATAWLANLKYDERQ